MQTKTYLNMFGIDVSQNNGKIDWERVKTNNPKIEFAFIKASEGIGYYDKRLIENATNAHKAGIKVGYYHFATLNKTDVISDSKSEAEYFLTLIKNLPQSDLPLILDLERNDAKVPPASVLKYINNFFACLGSHKYALYSYTPFLNANLPANHGLGKIPLWIAAYTPTLKLPRGWDKQWLWQYDNKGKIAGINANVDVNK
jgi:GH25 family lysozyme M1 (1,4-beta-N-acetylmuramidase)